MAESDRPLRASIIIVNYNGGAKIIKCLEALLKDAGHDAGSIAEVIVVDNASSDGSAEQIEVRFPGLKLIRAGKNIGFGAGNNLGAKHARGNSLVFVNPDTTVHEHWLSALLDPVDEPGARVLATSKIVMGNDPSRINACGNRVHLTGLTLCRGLNSPAEGFNTIEEVDAVSGAAFAISSDLFQKLGGFDEEMFLYVEDTDLSLRAWLLGAKCLFIPDSVVEHDYALKITPLKIFYQEKNRYLMLLKVFRWPTLVVLSPALLGAELISWGFVLMADRNNIGNKIRAYGWVCSNRRSILKQRRNVQSLRQVRDRRILQKMAVVLDFGQAARGPVGAFAHLVFDPFFFVMKLIVLAIVWW